MAGGEEGPTLEFTPTWVVAVVCSVIVLISLSVERILHYLGKYLKKKDQKPLFEALQKIKEELMLLGFISLLMTVFQARIAKICISKELANKWLPCKKEETGSSTVHFQTFFHSFVSGAARHLLAEASDSTNYCETEGKVPLLSTTALHHLHIFIFVLAVVHVTFCALTILFGGVKIHHWKHWEDSAKEGECTLEEVDPNCSGGWFPGIVKESPFLGWLLSFFKQFYGTVTKTDYLTLRMGFLKTHSPGNLQYNFHGYVIRTLEFDFKKVVGISWYLWLFVVIFLLLNVSGWHTYFWIAFIPFILLLAVRTKLERIIAQLTHEVAKNHDVVFRPSDDHFWFHRPWIVLLLIHIILFQNPFKLAFFFWIWVQYGFDSCIMGEISYIIPRLVIGGFVQFVCSYSTLPLYAIVTQMGSSFKKEIFPEKVQEGLTGWGARHTKMNKRKGVNFCECFRNTNGPTTTHGSHGCTSSSRAETGKSLSAMEEGNAEKIAPTTVSHGQKPTAS